MNFTTSDDWPPQKVEMYEQTTNEHALAALDTMAETWAEEIGLDAMIRKITSVHESRVLIRRLAMQSYVEGLYRGRTSVVST